MNDKKSDVLILGIGNVLMGDEGIGSHVAQFISERPIPEGITSLDGGTGGFYLLEVMQEARAIVLIDATCDGHAPGTVTELRPRFSTDYPRTLTAHDIGLKDMLDALYLLGKVPDIQLFAVSIDLPDDVTTLLSPDIENLIPSLAERALQAAKARL